MSPLAITLIASVLSYIIAKIISGYILGDGLPDRYPVLTKNEWQKLKMQLRFINLLDLYIPLNVYLVLRPEKHDNYTISLIFICLTCFVGFILGRIT
jgi:hypothetical protein